jgi:hypothetical protein
MSEEEKIIGSFPSQIRTIWDHVGYRAIFTDSRIALLDISDWKDGAGMAFGVVGMLVENSLTKKKKEQELKDLEAEAKTSLDELIKSRKKNLEIRYDRIDRIEYVHGKSWGPPILVIHSKQPIYKSKNKVNLAIIPDLEYRKAKKEQGIGEGKSFIEFSKELASILQPVFGNKMIIK